MIWCVRGGTVAWVSCMVQADEDNSGEIEFEEFHFLMKVGPTQHSHWVRVRAVRMGSGVRVSSET